MADLDTEALLTGDDKIVAEAKRRFKKCQEWESNARKLFVDDVKFANADADNGWQWPSDIRIQRLKDERPNLTINKVRQHCLNVINDAKQNKPSVSIKPVGGGATYQAAKVFEGIVRHIEYISNAHAAYDTATTFQVQGGIGYWRIVTDYAGDDTFDQEIFLRRVKDPLTVYLDPDIQEIDGSDARYGFVFEDMPKEEYDATYPDDKDKAGQAALGNSDGWIDKDYVRVAEYYRAVEVKDRLIAFTVPETGERKFLRASDIEKDLLDSIVDDPQSKIRDIVDTTIEWFLIAGDKIIERRVGKDVWPGRYVPIVRVIGEETIIDGQLDRKGHVRALKDPQRIYNYWSSSAVEHVALQGKTPYIAPADAIEGYETYWETANTVNHSILPYNGKDASGNRIDPPARAQPPVMATAYVQGMQIASEELRAASGQYQADMGMPGNEKSGVAIQQRQRQGDNATYHYVDNLALGIRFTGKILVDLIPKIYDTPRVMKIMAEDGSEQEISLDPDHPQAHEEQKGQPGAQQRGDAAQIIFNPNVGKYDVESDIGPAYATRRQEAFNAFTQIVSQNKDLMPVIGDLMFKNADFPGAEEIAERLKRLVPPQAMGDGPSPTEQQAVAKVEQMQGVIKNLVEQLTEMTKRSKEQGEKIGVDIFNAETNRIKALGPAMDPAQIAQLTAQIVLEALHGPMLGSDPNPAGAPPDAAAAPMPAEPLPGPMPMGDGMVPPGAMAGPGMAAPAMME